MPMEKKVWEMKCPLRTETSWLQKSPEILTENKYAWQLQWYSLLCGIVIMALHISMKIAYIKPG